MIFLSEKPNYFYASYFIGIHKRKQENPEIPNRIFKFVADQRTMNSYISDNRMKYSKTVNSSFNEYSLMNIMLAYFAGLATFTANFYQRNL
jgi:hypothetical protein